MLWNGLLAGMAIVVGALVVLAMGEPSERMLALMLALAAGVMAAVAGWDLLPAAVSLCGKGAALAGFVLGGVVMQALGRLLDRLPRSGVGDGAEMGRMGYLVFAGVALHDILEGMAVAAGYGVMEQLGLVIVVAIGVHHIPEGIAMAAPLQMSGVSRGRILRLALLTGLMTPFGVILGRVFIGLDMGLMGMLLAAAGGAMAALAFFELCPQAWRCSAWGGRLGFAVGLAAMSWVCLGMA